MSVGLSHDGSDYVWLYKTLYCKYNDLNLNLNIGYLSVDSFYRVLKFGQNHHNNINNQHFSPMTLLFVFSSYVSMTFLS